MTARRPPNRRARAGLAALAAMVLITGCGTGLAASSSRSTTSALILTSGAPSTPQLRAHAVAAVVAALPAAVKSAGTLNFATVAGNPPYDFLAPSGGLEGLDVDLAKALGAVMGLRVSIQLNTSLQGVMSGTAQGAYDIGAASLFDTRAAERSVDLVDYFLVKGAYLTRTHDGTRVSGLSSLCGHKVAVQVRTPEQGNALGQSRACVLSGKPAVVVLNFPSSAAAERALTSGRVQLLIADNTIAQALLTGSNGALRFAGPSYPIAFLGLAVPKRDHLDRAVLAALRAVIASGAYASVLSRWDAASGALSARQTRINGAGSPLPAT